MRWPLRYGRRERGIPMFKGLLNLLRPARWTVEATGSDEALDRLEEGSRSIARGSAYHSLGAISGGGYWP
jgi:hypothetical protein